MDSARNLRREAHREYRPSNRRNLLTHPITVLEKAGHKIVAHVHDEIIIDEAAGSGFTVTDACHLMSTPPRWVKVLPLDADGYERDYYRKE